MGLLFLRLYLALTFIPNISIAFWQDLWSNNLPDFREVDIEEDNSDPDYCPLCKTKTEPKMDEIFEREMEEHNSSGASEGGNLNPTNPTQATKNGVENRIAVEKATKPKPTVEEQVKELLAAVEILTKKRNEYHLNESIKSKRVYVLDNGRIQYLRSGERPPFREQLVEQNTGCYSVVDPRKEPTSLDWSNLRLEELKNRVDGASVGKPHGAEHTSHEADDPEQSNPGAPQTNDAEKEKSRSSESESAFHPSEGTEGDDNRLDILDLDQPRLRRTQQTRKHPNRKILFTNLKNLYRVVYAIKNRLKSFKFPDLPVSPEETNGMVGLRGSVKIRTMTLDHKITLDYNYN